jgi:hypothetical protein
MTFYHGTASTFPKARSQHFPQYANDSGSQVWLSSSLQSSSSVLWLETVRKHFRHMES